MGTFHRCFIGQPALGQDGAGRGLLRVQARPRMLRAMSRPFESLESLRTSMASSSPSSLGEAAEHRFRPEVPAVDPAEAELEAPRTATPVDKPRKERRPPAGKSVGLPPPRVRRGSLRIPHEAAHRLRGGHPWVFRDTLGDRPVHAAAGEPVELHDPEGGFVARGIYDPDGPIAVRVISRDPDELIDQAAFTRRVRAAAQLRAQLLPLAKEPASPGAPPPLTAYRVVNGEGDFLPGITVDRYGDYLVIHLYSGSLEPHLKVLLDALEDSYHPKGIYMQRRFRPLGGEGPRDPAELVRGQIAPVELEVSEGGLRFGVDVTSPLSSGLFLDLRLGRQAVAARSRGRRVLNLFSYTGALSLYAMAGGAAEVVSVDLSARAHARARRNLTLSGLTESGQEFITGDAMAIMTRMAERRRHFDMVIIDPPAFAQGRDKNFSVQRDYRDLVRAALLLCRPGSLLCCVANAAKFSIEDLMNAIGDGAGQSRRFVRIIDQLSLPPDFPVPAGFPEGYYLKVLFGAVI
jgi:23S rRNA (cytosine1962-C5)-methyltransferase